MTESGVVRRQHRAPTISARQATTLTASICVTLTLVVLLADLDPTLGSRRIHVGIEVADAMVLLFVAAVLVGRYRANGSRPNLLLLTAAIVLAVKNLLHAVGIVIDEDIWAGDQTLIWATATTHMLGAALLAASALVPDARVRHVRTAGRVLALGVAAVVTLFVVAAALEGVLPSAFDPLPEDLTELRLLSGHPLKIVINIVTTGCYVVAAYSFARSADEHEDVFMRWFAIGAVIAAVAFVNYAMYPSRFTDLLYGGELLWIGAVAALLYGSVREISNLEAAHVRSAVLEERKRVARDLHDGVAQELAFISSQLHWLSRQADGPEPLGKILASVERALDEARGAIASLKRPVDEPFDVALGHAAGDVADRVGARLRLDLDASVEVTSEWRDALLRIAREAVGNAVRHGHARTIALELRNGHGVSLSITDDGEGFDVTAPRSSQSFGLTGMRERTESLGGQFVISSAPGAGTTVKVELP